MSAAVRLVLQCAALLVGAVALLLLLNHSKFASTFESRLQQRIAITALDTARSLDAQMALGIALSDTPAQRGVLQRARQADAAIEALAVIDARGARVVSDGQLSADLLQASSRSRAGTDGRRAAAQGVGAVLTLPLTDAYGLSAGTLAIQYGLGEVRRKVTEALRAMAITVGIGLLACLVVLGLVGPRLIRQQTSGQEASGQAAGPRPHLGWMLLAMLLGLQALIAVDAYRSFQRVALQDAPSLAGALARTLEPTLQRALQSGIELNDLQGTDAWLSSSLDAGPEFVSVRLMDLQGRTLGQAVKSGIDVQLEHHELMPVTVKGETVARLQVGLDPAALSERSRQMAIEFFMLLLAGGLLIHEALRALTHGIASGGRAVAGVATSESSSGEGLEALRFPLFLYFLGSELPRTFLPIWARDLAAPERSVHAAEGGLAALLQHLPALPPSLQVSLPLSVFLLAVAVSSPFAGAYCARHGARRLLYVGLAFALAGHLLSLVADSLPSLTLARIVAGISFGCVSLAALDFIGRQAAGRAGGMAMYLTAYVAAGIAGSGLGALIYDRAGTGAVFGFGVMCSAVALIAMTRFPLQAASEQRPHSLMSSLGVLLRTPGFRRLIVLASLPLQIVQQGLLFYWVPLAVLFLGERTSFTGLAMMAYFVMVLVLNKPVARAADRRAGYGRLLAGGLVLAGVAGVLGTLATGVGTDSPADAGAANLGMLFASVVLIGIAWALAFPSQGAMALTVSRTELPSVDPAVAMGVYRTIERIGAMLTPIITAALIAWLGIGGSALAMGIMLLLCAVLQSLLSRRVS